MPLAFCDPLLTGYDSMNDRIYTFPKFMRRYSNCTPHMFLWTIAVCCDFSCNLPSGSRRAVFLAQDTIQWWLILSYIDDAWGAGWIFTALPECYRNLNKGAEAHDPYNKWRRLQRATWYQAAYLCFVAS